MITAAVSLSTSRCRSWMVPLALSSSSDASCAPLSVASSAFSDFSFFAIFLMYASLLSSSSRALASRLSFCASSRFRCAYRWWWRRRCIAGAREVKHDTRIRPSVFLRMERMQNTS